MCLSEAKNVTLEELLEDLAPLRDKNGSCRVRLIDEDGREYQYEGAIVSDGQVSLNMYED